MFNVYTIGHSNRPVSHLLNRLTRHGITTIVDIRSVPFSQWTPQYNQPSLKDVLFSEKIEYRWLGDSLGGMPKDVNLYTRGRPDYDKIRNTADYQSALVDVVDLARQKDKLVALMCAEKDPVRCHRRNLVGSDLLQWEANLWHILDSGQVISEDGLRRKLKEEKEPTILDVFRSGE